MALTDEQKQKIEDEEAYRAKLRVEKETAGTNSTHKRWYQSTGWIITFLILFFPLGILLMWQSSWNKLVKIIITIFFLYLIVINIKPISKEANNNVINKQNSAEDQKKKDEERKQQLQELSTLFCSERSKSEVRYVNLDDFIAMYKAKGESVTLKPAGGTHPTAENCQKVMSICLDMWNADDCKNIAERKIWIGMTNDELILSWGLPNDRNNSNYSFGIHSQWVYGSFGPYVYLEGKDANSLKVTSWQDSN